jgi:hypothetical protein
VKYLTVVNTQFTPYTKYLKKGTQIYDIKDGKLSLTDKKIEVSTYYTIVDETDIVSIKYGKLKSGAGWVAVGTATKK